MMICPNKKFGFIFAMARERAFTLFELLIATGITVVIVVLLGTMLGSLLNTASHTSQRVDAFRDARAALQIMERDLSNLVRTQWNPDPFSSPTPSTSPQPMTRPAAYFAATNLYSDPYPTGTPPNGQIFALISKNSASSATPTPSAGDVCAVGYYCRWDGNHYTLRRFFNNSTATFNVMTSTASYASASPSPSPALYSPSVNDEVLATDVWNLNIIMYSSAGTQIAYPYICDPSATTPNPLPAAIEISFNVMSPQAARTVMSVSSNPADWMSMNVNLVKPHAYQFRTRINLQ
jgi:type II secretory pathway pseudopilin PulG